MLQISNLNYLTILNNVTMGIPDNTFVSIIGQNGSGKTTLLKCLCGIYRDYTGSISLNRELISNLPQKKISQAIAYVPQIVGTVIPFTLFDFLKMSRYPISIKNNNHYEKQIIFNIMKLLDIDQFKHRIVSSLSGGEIQKALIASALVQETPVVLLDEPTSHLDPAKSHEITELLKKIQSEKNKSFIMVSHKLNEVKALSDRVIALKEGAKILDVTLSEFNIKQAMSDVYGIHLPIEGLS